MKYLNKLGKYKYVAVAAAVALLLLLVWGGVDTFGLNE